MTDVFDFEQYFEEHRTDILRYLAAREERDQRADLKATHLGYCRRYMEGTPELTEDQMAQVDAFWAPYADVYKPDSDWIRMYSGRTGHFDPGYISNDLHYGYIEDPCLDREYLRGFTDKNYLGVVFPFIKQPECVARRICGFYYDGAFNPVSKDEALRLCAAGAAEGRGLIIKPSARSWGGRNIDFLTGEMSSEEVDEVLSAYGVDVVIQRVVEQSPALAKVHPDSVNTVRALTMIEDGQVNVVSVVLRMGIGSSKVDNFSQGGVACGINPDGTLKSVGYDNTGVRYDCHPSGIHFEEITVPNFDGLLACIKRAHMHVPMFGVASWDFALDENDEPVLIEYNVGKGEIDFHQFNNGPLYGSKVKERLDRVLTWRDHLGEMLQFGYEVFADRAEVTRGSKTFAQVIIPARLEGKPVTRIRRAAFTRNEVLESVVVPEGVTVIEDSTFFRCVSLTEVRLPGSLRRIDENAFNSCTHLASVTLPEGLTEIGRQAFKDCVALKRVCVPASVRNIDETAFVNCKGLVFVCEKNSFAGKWATAHGIKIKKQ